MGAFAGFTVMNYCVVIIAGEFSGGLQCKLTGTSFFAVSRDLLHPSKKIKASY